MSGWQQETARYLAQMGEVGVEIAECTEGAYLTIPVAYRAAVEVEVDIDDGAYFVSLREWDQTNGLLVEELVVTISARTHSRMVARIVKGVLDEYAAIQDEAEAEINEAFGILGEQ